MRAWSRATWALCRVLITELHVGLKCSVYKRVVQELGCHQRNDLLDLAILPGYRGNSRGGIKGLKCSVKSFLLSKVKSHWKENKEMCEMQNQEESS